MFSFLKLEDDAFLHAAHLFMIDQAILISGAILSMWIHFLRQWRPTKTRKKFVPIFQCLRQKPELMAILDAGVLVFLMLLDSHSTHQICNS
ncbi:CLUMA_CG016623, isoform A [Clunio marinus]|uniref:CLUMA_CG016623, isoform A n=1 Tax=Clunio marinus TaxID=568069 RepID=A0A1J1IX59_9DIPT|nr:CLUMA_CG016623, isoform A [Clunio marinus]